MRPSAGRKTQSNHRSRQPRRERASALQGAGADGLRLRKVPTCHDPCAPQACAQVRSMNHHGPPSLRIENIQTQKSGPRIPYRRLFDTDEGTMKAHTHVQNGTQNHVGVKTRKNKRNPTSRQPRRESASALEGAGAQGQHRATPTRAAAPEAPPRPPCGLGSRGRLREGAVAEEHGSGGSAGQSDAKAIHLRTESSTLRAVTHRSEGTMRVWGQEE